MGTTPEMLAAVHAEKQFQKPARIYGGAIGLGNDQSLSRDGVGGWRSNQPPLCPLLDLSGSSWLRSVHPWARFGRADGGGDGQEDNEEQGSSV